MARPSPSPSTTFPSMSAPSPYMRATTSRCATARFSSTVPRPPSTPSPWTTIGCRATTATTASTRASGASYPKTTSWASQSSSGSRSTRTAACSMVRYVGTACSAWSRTTIRSQVTDYRENDREKVVPNGATFSLVHCSRLIAHHVYGVGSEAHKELPPSRFSLLSQATQTGEGGITSGGG